MKELQMVLPAPYTKVPGSFRSYSGYILVGESVEIRTSNAGSSLQSDKWVIAREKYGHSFFNEKNCFCSVSGNILSSKCVVLKKANPF